MPINFGAIGTALGGFFDGYDKAKQRGQRDQLYQQEQQDRQRKERSDKLFFDQVRLPGGSGLQSPGGGSAPGQAAFGGGGAAAQAPAAGYAPEEPAAAPSQSASIPPQYSPAPQGSGFSSGLPRGGSGADQLRALLDRSQTSLPEGYRAEITSGERPGARVAGTGGTSQHALNNAIDTRIVGPEGPIPNKGEDTTGMYKRLALGMRSNAGDLAPKLAWGGNFTTGGANGPRDLMHFDLAGDRGKFGTLAQLAQAAPPEMKQAVQQTGRSAMQGVDPSVYGRMSIEAIARRIDQAAPNEDPVVKMMALEATAKLLAPDQRERWEMFKQQNEQAFRRELQDRTDARQDKTIAASDARQERGIVAGEQRQQQRDVAAEERLDKRLSSGGGRAAQNIEVTDGEGKVIFSGSARQTQQGWIADKDQKPVEVPDDGNVKMVGRGGQGRQAAAQIQSMIGASSELVGEAKNLMELPSTAVAGIFQGVQSVPANKLGEAVARTMANKLTPEEATDLATSFQGVARSLATIEAQGRATGLVGLTGMSQGLMPQTGDTTGNVLRKMATLRQIMERNIDAIEASPNASAEQKKLLKNLKTEMAAVVPFTVSEVNKLQHGDAETVMQAAKKFGLAGGGGAQGGPAPGTVQDGYRFKGGDPAQQGSWERVQ